MNPFNSYNHLVTLAGNSATARASQEDFNRARLDAVIRAKRMRPQFLPVRHDLPNSQATVPFAEATEELQHNVVVFGAMTDGENRRAKILADLDGKPLVRVSGVDGVSNLTLEAIAGESVTTTAQPNPSIFPNPYNLRGGQVLTLEMFQETNLAAQVNTVFLGTRALTSNADDAMLSAAMLETVKAEIEKRVAPETKFSTAKVVFKDNIAVAETPKADEPLLVLGFRATFEDALVNFGFDTNSQFAKSPFPIWALAPKKRTAQGMFLMLREALFIPPQQKLIFTLKNTINGATFAENGQIELLLATV